MKDLMVKVWGYVPNKSQVLMTAAIVCVVISILGGSAVWFGGNVVVYKGETTFEVGMRHIHQWSKHDNDTIKAHTDMFVMLPEFLGGAARLQKLEDDLAKHKRGKVDYMDRDGNFLSDFYEAEYKEGEKELERNINNQRMETIKDNSYYSGKVEYAQRDR